MRMKPLNGLSDSDPWPTCRCLERPLEKPVKDAQRFNNLSACSGSPVNCPIRETMTTKGQVLANFSTFRGGAWAIPNRKTAKPLTMPPSLGTTPE